MVADLVETSRLYGRTGARIDPETVERVAGHLIARSYSEPHWDAERGAAMAFERVTLYGLPLVARRRVAARLLDAVLEGVKMLETRSPNNRRVMLIFSESRDRGSKTRVSIAQPLLFTLFKYSCTLFHFLVFSTLH